MVIPYVVLLVMLIFIATAIGFVMLSRYTNNTNAAQFHATTVSELIVHVVPVFGCVVLVTFVMFWMSRSAEIESVESAFLVEGEVEVGIINFY